MSEATERLLVRIDASTESLRREMKKADDVVGKSSISINDKISKFSKSFAAAGVAAAKWGAAAGLAAGTATAALVKSGLSTVDSLAKTSDKLGIATEALARYRFAAQQTGVEQNKADVALQRFTRRLSDAAAGTGPAVQAFDALGLSAKELVDLAPDQAFAKVADKMNLVENSSQKVSLAFKLFDSEGVALVNTLALGSDGLADMAAQADAAGLSLSRIDGAKVEAANDAMARVQSTMSGFSQQLAVQFAPVLEGIADRLFGITKESGGMAKAAEKAFGYMVKAAGFLGDSVKALQVGWHLMKLAFQESAKFIIGGLDKLAISAQELWNALPWTDEIEVESLFSGFLATMESEIATSQQKIDDLLSEPLPSAALENYVDDAARAFEAEAIVVAQSQGDIQESLITTGQVTESLATTTEKAAVEVESAWDKALQGTVERIDSAFAEAWKGSFDSFSAFSSSLKDAFKNLLAEMAHMAITRPIIMSIGGAVGLGASSAASAAGSVASGASGLSSLSSLAATGFGNLTSGYQWAGQQLGAMGFHGAAGNAYNAAGQYAGGGWSAAGNLGLNLGAGVLGGWAGNQIFGETSGIGSAVGGIVGSMFGPIGTGIGSFIGAGLEKAVTNIFGIGGQGNNAAAAEFDLSQGTIDSITWGNNKSDPENVTASMDLASGLQAMAYAIGGSSYSGRVEVGTKRGITIDGQKVSDSAEFIEVAFEKIVNGADHLDQQMRELLLGFEGTADETMQFASAVISMNDAAGINSVTEAIKQFNAEQPTVYRAYQKQSASLVEMVADFDGSAEAAQALNSALIANKTAAYEMAIAIQAMGDQITSVATDQAQSIRESVMSTEDLRATRMSERNSLRGDLGSMTDPEQIAAASARILELNRLIFDSLGDEAQGNRAEDFATYAERTAEQAQRRLDLTLDKMATTQDDLNKQVATMLQATAAQQQQAADTQLQAANQFGAYVQSLISNGITVNLGGLNAEVV